MFHIRLGLRSLWVAYWNKLIGRFTYREEMIGVSGRRYDFIISNLLNNGLKERIEEIKRTNEEAL